MINPEDLHDYIDTLNEQFLQGSKEISIKLDRENFKLTLQKDPSPSFPFYTLEYGGKIFKVEINPFTSEGVYVGIFKALIAEINREEENDD